MPQTLVVTFADGSKETAHWNGDGHWARFSWTKPVKAVSAELDPERKNSLDANYLDNSRTMKPDNAASRRWSADIAAIAQSFFALLETL